MPQKLSNFSLKMMNLKNNNNIFNEHFNWWNPQQQKNLVPLHALNKTRLEYILKFASKITGKKILDYGCGGGLLCEPLSILGGNITGFDAEPFCIDAAKAHAMQSEVKGELNINYTTTIPQPSPQNKYDIICCFEMLEHTQNIEVEIANIKALLKPSGLLFLSTINKNIKSLIFAKFVAEYVLNLVPRGMHNFNNFITPQTLINACGSMGIALVDMCGMFYNPLTKQSRLIKSTDINYICVFKNE